MKPKIFLLIAFFLFSCGASFGFQSVYRVHDGDYLDLFLEASERREENFTVLADTCLNYLPIKAFLESFACYAPYHYWHLDSFWAQTSTCNRIEVDASWLTTGEEEEELFEELENLLSDISELPDYEKLKYVHDLMVANVSYNFWAEGSAYHLLFHREGICTSYTLLTLRALEFLGIEATAVDGYGNGALHLWNMVRLCCGDDCRWFHLDVTWDDPLPDEPGRVSYRYFLLSDEEIRRDHVVLNSCGKTAPESFRDWRARCEARGKEIYSPGVFLRFAADLPGEGNSLRTGEPLRVELRLKLFELSAHLEEMVCYFEAHTPFGVFWYAGGRWHGSRQPFWEGFPRDLEEDFVFPTAGLPEGPYTLYFRVKAGERELAKKRLGIFLRND